ncbi:MAG: TPM domain-containing protein [Rhodothermaceae bacterium]|nr:TPM domain-containing protein [Rhodothermaceae bacterium]MYC04610.1 TPM domain-containing protein [Rhodothermaceae bacterium]MYI16720.1 TPM domain-containing protein [Rhodothermaceae bacterium]
MTIWKSTFCLASVILMVGCLIENQISEPDWIVDRADVLDAEEESALLNLLSDFYDSTSVTIVGVTAESVRGQSIELHAASLYASWELGSIETHNGILVLLRADERLVQITVGSGMAQELTSLVLDSIKVEVAELFGLGDYYGGFERGFDLLMRRAGAVPWTIAYTSIIEAERDSLRSIDQIISTEGLVTGFQEDLVILTDSDGREARLMVPAEAPILSLEDVIGFTGRIVEVQPVQIRVVNLEVDPIY